MTIIQIIVVFLIFAVVWILTNILWKIIEGKMLIRLQNEKMDALYAKTVRLILKAVKDYKDLKEVINRD